ncbi:exonuclease II Exo2, partial [Coemansia erecta]
MLGLLSHEPHFSLLREEVLFGPRARSSGASADPAMQSFYLLHISILRDYLDHEFSGLKTALGCSPQYAAMEQGCTASADAVSNGDPNAFDLERIIDDYVLMIMLVGNDFLPNLPKLSINGGALNFMFSTYARIRPALGGYLHDNGKLNLARLQVFMREIERFEVDAFKLDVASHQWYQVYKHKATLHGETPDESTITSDSAAKGGGRRGKRYGRNQRHDAAADDGFGDESAFDLPDGFYSSLGEATIPIKGNQFVLSRSQQDLLDLIRKFAIRALPKAAVAGHKVQLQFLPGTATPLDSLIVAKAAELLDIHLGREYAYDGSMTLYVAAGSPKALAQLELEDGESGANDTDPFGSSGFFGSAVAQRALDTLEDTAIDEESDGAIELEENLSAVPDFVKNVSDPSDEVAVAAYVDACLSEFSNVLVVPDAELDNYTQKGDASDFWQRFEIWKAGYYKSKVSAAYDIPDVTKDAQDSGAEVAPTGQAFRVPAASVEPMCRSYIGTLQWVLQYYYHGCQSWSWYYPFHYAPCISDLCAGLEAYAIDNFGSDVPYTPYEQLMSVLPPYSRKLLPSVLRPLMVDIHSPIRDLYPTSFSVDMNGKKMPWEAVVLIDFVDIDRIRAAMKPKLAELNEDEQRRNSRGKNMAYSYAPIEVEDDALDAPAYTAPSSLNFPAIQPLKCKGIVYVMPSLKGR